MNSFKRQPWTGRDANFFFLLGRPKHILRLRIRKDDDDDFKSSYVKVWSPDFRVHTYYDILYKSYITMNFSKKCLFKIIFPTSFFFLYLIWRNAIDELNISHRTRQLFFQFWLETIFFVCFLFFRWWIRVEKIFRRV